MISAPVPTRPRAHRLARHLAVAGAAVAVLSGIAVVAGFDTPADAAPTGPDVIVSLGDSFVSGEGGRWAGNTTGSLSKVDALGADAYFDNATRTAEQIPMCHRSESAPVHIGGIESINLACSGARTATVTGGDHFKPGIDFYNGPEGKGQAAMLQDVATTKKVKMVVLGIGGNDFNFAAGVQTCVTNYLLTASTPWKNYCNDDSSITQNYTAANVTAKRAAIKQALLNVRTAMTNAGYTTSQYTIVIQQYVRPVATSTTYRYTENGPRHSDGGCGFFNRDADYASNTVIPTMNSTMAGAVADSGLTNVKTINVQDAFVGRRLCESTVKTLDAAGLASWQAPGAVDKTEWTQKVRTITAVLSDAFIEESVHPNYWGQLALRNCVRQAYNGGTPKGGTCTRTATGLNAKGEPNMTLQ